MIVQLPLYASPNRTFKIVLAGQECTITLRQKGRRLYMTLSVGDVMVCRDAVCLRLVPVVQVAQSVLSGNIVFVDTLGEEQPQYDGLGTRFFGVWYSEDEDLPNVSKNETFLRDYWGTT